MIDLLSVLREQRASRFRDVAGATASVTIPVSDRLVSRLVLDALPPAGIVRELDLTAHDANRFVVRVRLSRPAFLPTIAVTAFIERQPQLPGSPVLILRLSMPGGLLGLAAPVIRMMGALPPGLALEGERLEVHLAPLLERHGARDLLDYLESLELTTLEGRFVLSLRAAVN